jgi:hypothetical protein
MSGKVNVDKPAYSIECRTTIMTLAFHPMYPLILAAGGFDGHVYLWDLSK